MQSDAREMQQALHEGLCCSQALMLMALRRRGEENSSLLDAVSGLCMGMHGGQICGTLTAACLALALFDPKNAAAHMIPEFVEWFEQEYGSRYGGTDCMSITGGSLQMARCREIVCESWNKVAGQLAEFGFD